MQLCKSLLFLTVNENYLGHLVSIHIRLVEVLRQTLHLYLTIHFLVFIWLQCVRVHLSFVDGYGNLITVLEFANEAQILLTVILGVLIDWVEMDFNLVAWIKDDLVLECQVCSFKLRHIPVNIDVILIVTCNLLTCISDLTSVRHNQLECPLKPDSLDALQVVASGEDASQ